MRVLRGLIALLALPLLTGCLMLERAPADLSCDPELAGRWLPVSKGYANNPLGEDDYIEVDAQCRVTLVDAKKPNARPGFTARSFTVNQRRYLALSEADMRELFEDKAAPAGKLPATAVMPVQYDVVGDELQLQIAQWGYLGEQIKQGTIQVTEVDNYALLTGDNAHLRAVLTEHPQLFPGQVQAEGSTTETIQGQFFQLRRASAGAAP